MADMYRPGRPPGGEHLAKDLQLAADGPLFPATERPPSPPLNFHFNFNSPGQATFTQLALRHRDHLCHALMSADRELAQSIALIAAASPEAREELEQLQLVGNYRIRVSLTARAQLLNSDLWLERRQLGHLAPRQSNEDAEAAGERADQLFGDLNNDLKALRSRLDALIGSNRELASALRALRETADREISEQARALRELIPVVFAALEAERLKEAIEQARARLAEQVPSARLKELEPRERKAVPAECRSEPPPSIHQTKTVLDTEPQLTAQFLQRKGIFEVPILQSPLAPEPEEEQRRREEIRRRMRERGREVQGDLKGEISPADELALNIPELLELCRDPQQTRLEPRKSRA